MRSTLRRRAVPLPTDLAMIGSDERSLFVLIRLKGTLVPRLVIPPELARFIFWVKIELLEPHLRSSQPAFAFEKLDVPNEIGCSSPDELPSEPTISKGMLGRVLGTCHADRRD